MNIFPESYEESREDFYKKYEQLKVLQPKTTLKSIPLDYECSFDVITMPSRGASIRTLLWQNGQHGIEGFVGNACLNFFFENQLKEIDFENSNLIFVHSINPFGMKYFRRANENNVDLNRNFVRNWEDPNALQNLSYQKLQAFFEPAKPYSRLSFFLKVIPILIRHGAKTFEEAASGGQYTSSSGIYYGGKEFEPETKMLIEIYRTAFLMSSELTVLDFHTGYGPKRKLQLINSLLEEVSADDFKKKFGYEEIIACSSNDMYKITGDIIDFLYEMKCNECPEKKLYATCVEFGTFGDSTLRLLEAVRRFINENTLFIKQKKSSRVTRQYRNYFYPESKSWQKNCLKLFSRSANGILKARHFFNKTEL